MRRDRVTEEGKGLGCTGSQEECGVTITISKQGCTREQRRVRAEAVLDLSKSMVSLVIYEQGGTRGTKED